MYRFKQLEEMLSLGRINRREFLSQVSALGLTAMLSTSILSRPVFAGTPQKGGRLRIGCAGGSTSDTLDPATYIDVVAAMVGSGLLLNNLVEIDHKGDAIPELAESWEYASGGTQWIFKIRKGVEFHNGKTLDAEDVIFSINHHRGEDSKSNAKVIVDPIKEIKADGKHAVIFTLEAGNADFPFLLSDSSLGIVPAGTTNFEDGIGTGGYKLISWKPGIECFTKRNPNYWKEGRAHFDEVEITVINDVQARTNALKTGQVDVMNRCDRKTAHLLDKTPDLQVISTTGPQFYSMPMMTDMPPYNNNDVRLALKYGIDRKHILKMILNGYGSLGNDHPISPSMRFYASNLPQREYDPDKARFHIKKAGFEEHTFKFHVADVVFQGAIDTAILYTEHAAKAGIKITVVREPDDGYWSNVWSKKAWCMCYWRGRPTEDFMFSVAYSEDSAWNDTHWKHERFNKLLRMARSELDEAKRREMYVEMQRIVRDEGGVVIPVFANHVEAATRKLKFEKVAGNQGLDGYKIGERWWFES